MASTSANYCGVPGCCNARKPGVTLHKLPLEVLFDRKELLKWKITLKMRAPITKDFLICMRHFREDEFVGHIAKGEVNDYSLSSMAVPSQYLPLGSGLINQRIRRIKSKYKCLKITRTRKPFTLTSLNIATVYELSEFFSEEPKSEEKPNESEDGAPSTSGCKTKTTASQEDRKKQKKPIEMGGKIKF